MLIEITKGKPEGIIILIALELNALVHPVVEGLSIEGSIVKIIYPYF